MALKVSTTVPLVVPEAPDVTWIQLGSLATAVHGRWATTATWRPTAPMAGAMRLPGLTVSVGAACFTVNVRSPPLDATEIVPVRPAPVTLPATV